MTPSPSPSPVKYVDLSEPLYVVRNFVVYAVLLLPYFLISVNNSEYLIIQLFLIANLIVGTYLDLISIVYSSLLWTKCALLMKVVILCALLRYGLSAIMSVVHNASPSC